jgi:hypothetical protein
MDRFHMRLQEGIRGELCKRSRLGYRLKHLSLVARMARTLRANKFSASMDPAFVRPEMARRVERLSTLRARNWVDVRTWERFLVQMDHLDMFLESRMLPKRFVAWRVPRAPILVPSFVRGQVSP